MADSGSTPHDAVAGDSEPVPREIADEELQLLAQYTGQSDLAALRQHVVALWRRAISGDAPVYLCVRGLMFLEPRIRGHPRYRPALQHMGAARAAAAADGRGPPLWLDVGSAVGADVRALRVDGLAASEVAALDVEDSRHYWEVGLELFQDAASPPCPALFGDIIDDAVLPPAPAAAAAAAGTSDGSATADADAGGSSGIAASPGSIASLAGQVDVVSCTAVLHTLGRQQVDCLLQKMAVLLRPGGLLLGSTLGAADPHAWEAAYQPGRTRWLHSAASLAEALAAAGYEGVVVEPTSWRSIGSITPLMEQHVGRQLGLGERCMLAFSAAKPTAPGAAAASAP